jgi:hypothetical protein
VVTAPTEAEVAEVVAAAAEVDAGGGAEADATRDAAAIIATTEQPTEGGEGEEEPEPKLWHELTLETLSDFCDAAADGELLCTGPVILIADQLAAKVPADACGELALILQAAYDGIREVSDEYIRRRCEDLWKRAKTSQEAKKSADITKKGEVFVGTELPQYQPLDTGDDPPEEDEPPVIPTTTDFADIHG